MRLDNANTTSSSKSGRAISRRIARPASHQERGLTGRARRPSAAVHPLAQFLACLEERHRLLVHRYRLAGARIAPGPGVPPLHSERAESAQFDSLAACKCDTDLVENGRHNHLD